MLLNLSRFCEGFRCAKQMWLSAHRQDLQPELQDGDAPWEASRELKELAWLNFKEVANVNMAQTVEMQARDTQRLLKTGSEVISDAVFIWGELCCRVDILRRTGENQIEFYMVKSSKGWKKKYLPYVSYPYYILSGLGYRVRGAFSLLLNENYSRCGELEPKKLFVTYDAIEEARTVQEDMPLLCERLLACLAQEEEPRQELDTFCFPRGDYTGSSCGYFSYCTASLPHPNIFDVRGVIRNAGKNELPKNLALYRKGVVSFADLDGCSSLNDKQKMQVNFELHGNEPHIDIEKIRGFLATLSFPLYFLDFETIKPTIPLYDGTSPNDQFPFLYSLHWVKEPGGKLEWADCFASTVTDPRRKIAEALCRDIPKDACVLAYNMSFEKNEIKKLAQYYPDLGEHLMAIYDNIKDLMVPFKDRSYYTKEMKGSYSIKKVLPALFPDNPDMDYAKLGHINNGLAATEKAMKMRKMNVFEQEAFEKAVRYYCWMDTYAMVMIWAKLMEVIK